MPTQLPAGPYRNIPIEGGTAAPFYIIPFDSEGRCEGPRTRAHLVEAVRSGEFSDVYLFSHGWNNDWKGAIERYESFLKGFMGMRRD